LADAGQRSQRREPQDPVAERALLGSILLSPESLFEAREHSLDAEHFSQEPHRLLYSCFVDLAAKGMPVDLVTVSGYLEERSTMQKVGGFSYLTGLSSGVPSIANFAAYVRTVLDKAVQRRLLVTARTIEAGIYAGEESAAQSLESAEKQIYDLGQSHQTSKLHRIDAVVEEVYETLERRFQCPEEVTGVPTGFRDLDTLLTGLQPSDLVILAARPSMGKTAFALNIAANAALMADAAVAFFSLEMSKEQLATRLLCADARVSGQRVRMGKLVQEDWPPLTDAMHRLSKARMYIDDMANIPVSELRGKCRRLKAEGNLDLIIIDYLQLMRPDRDMITRNASREQEISSISAGLKAVAKELQVPVLALSQLNRGVESRADKRPMLSDLRESGAIEQDADVIMFLYRDEFYNEASEKKGLAEVLVRKQRNGPTDDIELAWRAEITRFENLARDNWHSASG
jgi:replicative DNA helicase